LPLFGSVAVMYRFFDITPHLLILPIPEDLIGKTAALLTNRF